MKVILNQDVPNLGEEGEVREVTNGYGRNYLIPKKLAVPYNKSSVAVFESRKSAIEKRKEEKRKQALGLKERLESEEIIMQMPAGESGKLFGSVTNATIMEELEKRGVSIEKKRIEVPEHTIKQTGNYTIKVRLYDNESAEVKVSVQNEDKEKEKEEEV